jgi:UDP-N-acetylglucosamine--N-acetylmuramyl-(pentapeptide) pyrophosphoryl-undecaprenol N-acetylglucosamine transferase
MKPNFKNALVITGGGTGGHYYPAVALAEAAEAKWQDCSIVFVGAMRGIEGRKLPESKWPYLLMDVEGFVGKSPIKAMRSLWRMYGAYRILKKTWKIQRPRAVIGTGGYGAGPALLAARALNIPYFIHESNAEPGLIVKLVANGAKRVWLGMDAAGKRLPKADCLYVGTPVRKSFLRPFKPYSDLHPPFTMLVLGGSGGARSINNALLSIGSTLLEKFVDWEITHQVGNLEMQKVNEHSRHPKHTIVPYIENMDTAIESASLVLSRAGASTCSELKTVGRPTVLVPLPNSAGDHQKHNALSFLNEGRGVMVEQGQAFDDRLFEELCTLMADTNKRMALSRPEPNIATTKCLDDMTPWIESTLP